jgi:hypothetical protein
MVIYTIQDDEVTIELCRDGRNVILHFNDEEEAFYLTAEVAESLCAILSKLLFKD